MHNFSNQHIIIDTKNKFNNFVNKYKKNYKNMLDEFEYLIQRWKEK